MLCIILVLLDILSSVHGQRSSTHGEESLTISNKLQRFNISCYDGLIVVTLIERLQRHENSTTCLNPQYDICINISDDKYDRYRKFILARCSFQPSCSLVRIERYSFNIRITYKCVPGQSVIDICGGPSPILNIGDQRHLVLLTTAPSGACVCKINGSTEVVLRDFFTIKNLADAPNEQSDSKLWLGKVLYDSKTNSSIVQGDLSSVDVSSITFSFNNIIQRVWLRVDVKDNGTYIRCEDLTTNMATNSTSAGITTNAMNSSPTNTETTANEVNPEMNTVTVPQDLRRTPYQLMSPLTSSVPDPSKSRNTTTLGTPHSSTSVIVFVASGSVVIVVLMIVFGGILIVKHKRRQNLKRPRNVLKNKPQSERRPTLSIDPLSFENFAMEGIVNNEYNCQTVAHVPRITRGSVEYAVSMPPEIYHFECTPYDRPDSESMSSPKYINSSDNKHADDEDGLCNSQFSFRPLSEEVIRTDFGTCINDSKRAIHVAHDAANGTNERDTESTIHIYNHIMLGREVMEVNIDGSGLSSDEYSHISANDVVNIQSDRSRGQPSDEYCHIGSIHVNGRKHLSGDDYDHLVM